MTQHTVQLATSSSGKKIISLDASALKTSACILRFYRTLIEGWKSGAPSVDIVFGSAIHKFIECMRRNGGYYGPAIMEATKVLKDKPYTPKKKKEWMENPINLAAVCMHYWEHWRRKTDNLQTVVVDGKPLVELKFSFPYYVNDRYEVNLSGTEDDICRVMPNGMYLIRDYKSTSSWNAEEYLAKYRLSPQMKFYYFMVTQYAKMYPDSIYGEMVRVGFGCLIEGIFLNPDTSKTNVIRSEVFRYKEADMLEFKGLLDIQIQRLLAALDNSALLVREGMVNGACSMEFGCPFDNVCASPDSIAAAHVLRNNFIARPYDPLNF